jgi:hypothetical protein
VFLKMNLVVDYEISILAGVEGTGFVAAAFVQREGFSDR